MPQPADVNAAIEALTAHYNTAWNRVVSEQEAIAGDPARLGRARALEQMRQRIIVLMGEVDAQARQWIGETLPRIHDRGAGSTAEQMAAVLGLTVPQMLQSIRLPPRDALNALAGKLTDDLLDATEYVNRDTKRFIREVVRNATIQGTVAGSSLKDQAAEVRRLVEERGIHAIRYKDGSRMGLGGYAAMAVRTVGAVAYNRGALDSATSSGVEWMEVFDGPGCGWSSHNDGDPASGSIRKASDCEDHLLAHPNCRRSFGARPDITDDGEVAAQRAADALPATSSAEARPFGQPATADVGEALRRIDAKQAQRSQRLASRQARLDARNAPATEEPAEAPFPEPGRTYSTDETEATAEAMALHYGEWVSGLSTEDRAAFKSYLGTSTSMEINKALRDGAFGNVELLLGGPEAVRNTIGRMTDALRRAPEPPPGTVVWRSVRTRWPTGTGNVAPSDFAAHFGAGDVVRFDAFTSSSTDPHWGANFASVVDSVVFEIIPKRGAFVNQLHPGWHEREYLFAPGSEFRVASVREIMFETPRGVMESRWTIQLREV